MVFRVFDRDIDEMLLDQFQHGVGVFQFGIVAEGDAYGADGSSVNEIDVVSADMTPLVRECDRVSI